MEDKTVFEAEYDLKKSFEIGEKYCLINGGDIMASKAIFFSYILAS